MVNGKIKYYYSSFYYSLLVLVISTWVNAYPSWKISRPDGYTLELSIYYLYALGIVRAIVHSDIFGKCR